MTYRYSCERGGQGVTINELRLRHTNTKRPSVPSSHAELRKAFLYILATQLLPREYTSACCYFLRSRDYLRKPKKKMINCSQAQLKPETCLFFPIFSNVLSDYSPHSYKLLRRSTCLLNHINFISTSL